MRTDSTSLSEAALTAARRQATELFGPDFLLRRLQNAHRLLDYFRADAVPRVHCHFEILHSFF